MTDGDEKNESSDDDKDEIEVIKELRVGLRFTYPHDGRPIVKYPQGKSVGCMVCGLASALAFFGDDVKAKEIMGLLEETGNHSLGYNRILEQMRKKRTHQYDPVAYKEEYDTKTLATYPHVYDCILFVVLRSYDGGCSHSVSICQDLIFDANTNFALKLNKKNLDWCCSAPGVKAKFDRFEHAVYLYPRSIKYYHRIPSLMKSKDYTKLFEATQPKK